MEPGHAPKIENGVDPMKTLIAVASQASPSQRRVSTASFAGPDNGIMVHGYLGTAYASNQTRSTLASSPIEETGTDP